MDERYLKGIEFFNKRDFFEAHEEWEALWHDTHDKSKDFYQGLIQVTSAFHHFQHGNLRGARLLHDSGIELLAPYGDFFEGLDLKSLRDRFNHSFREIIGARFEDLDGRGHPGPVKVPFTPDRIFTIQLNEK
jgi:predicted metal-dependent hydrolase